MARIIRQLLRLTGLVGLGLAGWVEYAATIAWRRGHERDCRQGRWLQRNCQRLARLVSVRIRVMGRWSSSPMIACNHLSYLDIIVLGALTPVRFVAKKEVRQWPLVGWLARCAGTIFVRRTWSRELVQTEQQLKDVMVRGERLVVFPEGTSTDGQRVLPFRSSLLAIPAQESWPVLPVRLVYELEDGDASREVCWWGKMTLLPHLWRLLVHEEIRVTVWLGRIQYHWDRKELAMNLHEAVCGLGEVAQRKLYRNQRLKEMKACQE